MNIHFLDLTCALKREHSGIGYFNALDLKFLLSL